MKRTAAAIGAAIVLALATGAEATGGHATPPTHGFVRTIDNPWFPSFPGLAIATRA